MDAPHRVLELRLELDPQDADAASSPAGWLRGPAAPARRFEGYVQLIGVLHELFHAAAAAAAEEPGGFPR
jgi:hypothetical protein